MSLHQVRTAEAAPLPADDGHPTLALLDRVSTQQAGRVLILGHSEVEVICALIRRGCQEVTELRCCDRPEPAIAEIVLVPELASIEQAATVVKHASRALVRSGCVVLKVPGHLAGAVTGILRLQGFAVVRRQDSASGSILSARRLMSPGLRA